MEAFEDWLAHQMQGSGDLPEATFLALVGAEVVGYSKFSHGGPANHGAPRRDGREACMARSWNRRRTQTRADRVGERAGLRAPGHAERVRNEPIRRLNERLGYTEAPGQIVVSGPLAKSS